LAKFASKTVGDKRLSRDCTCLGQVWGHDTDRIIFIHVVPPKVAKTSKEGDITGVKALNFANVNTALKQSVVQSTIRRI
jgi:hypothetical protein